MGHDRDVDDENKSMLKGAGWNTVFHEILALHILLVMMNISWPWPVKAWIEAVTRYNAN